MPYTVVTECPLYEDHLLTKKTDYRVPSGAVFKIDETYPAGEGLVLADVTVKTLGQIPVVHKLTRVPAMKAGWFEGRFAERWVEDPQEGELPGGDVPSGTPTFEDAGRAVDTLVRFVKARL